MQALFMDLRAFLRSFCPAARKFFRFGVPTVAGMFLAALCCRLLLGTFGNYDKMLRIYEELLLCGQELFGAVFVSGLVLQLLYMAYAFDSGEYLQK